MVGYIYLITDTTNGKQYVGQHHYDKEELDSNYHGSGHIIKMIYKKRPETLEEKYLKTCYSQTELDEWEKYFIFTFNTLHPNGYNLEEGGRGGVPSEETRRKISNANKGRPAPNKGKPSPNKGKPMSEEQKKKISVANKGKLMSEEQKKKLSDINKGKPAPNKGIPMSEEQKKKLSESLKGKTTWIKGKHHSEETKKKISVANKGKHLSDQTKQKISESISGEKHPMFGKHHSEETKKKLSESLKGLFSGEKHPMFGKHHSEESKKKISEKQKGKKLSEETRRKMSKTRINGKQSKKILQFTLDGEFVREWQSIAECKRNGYNGANICYCCQGKRKSHKGFKWCYA